MEKINAKKVLFIKLGHGGEFEEDCILKDQTLRLSYKNVDHELCVQERWDLVHKYFLENENTTKGVATNHTNQIKQFYEEDEKTLWLTFHKNKLWWCFSKPEVEILPDKTKIRKVIGTWSDKNIDGDVLFEGNLSGKLLKTQGFRGTICKVPAKKYAIEKINNDQSKDVVEVEMAISHLKEKLRVLIQNLQWKDFETLVDLIFRQAGWQRLSEIGKTQKTLDLELLAPVTGERAIVQIKSDSNLKQFLEYQQRFEGMTDYNKIFYVVNNTDKSLSEYNNDSETILYFGDKIAELTINSGLVDWVIRRTS